MTKHMALNRRKTSFHCTLEHMISLNYTIRVVNQDQAIIKVSGKKEDRPQTLTCGRYDYHARRGAADGSIGHEISQ